MIFNRRKVRKVAKKRLLGILGGALEGEPTKVGGGWGSPGDFGAISPTKRH